MNLVKYFIVLIFCFILQHPVMAFGQSRNKTSEIKKKAKFFFDGKLNQQFSPLDSWRCLNGEIFNLDDSQNPTVIFLGFSSCPPCSAAIPTYAKVSELKEYSKYNFLYMTFDDSETIAREFKIRGIAKNKRIKCISISRAYLNAQDLGNTGYPTIYFLDSKNTVKSIYGFGAKDGPLDSISNWNSMLDSLK